VGVLPAHAEVLIDIRRRFNERLTGSSLLLKQWEEALKKCAPRSAEKVKQIAAEETSLHCPDVNRWIKYQSSEQEGPIKIYLHRSGQRKQVFGLPRSLRETGICKDCCPGTQFLVSINDITLPPGATAATILTPQQQESLERMGFTIDHISNVNDTIDEIPFAAAGAGTYHLVVTSDALYHLQDFEDLQQISGVLLKHGGVNLFQQDVGFKRGLHAHVEGLHGKDGVLVGLRRLSRGGRHRLAQR
jgi:hypothetical protein